MSAISKITDFLYVGDRTAPALCPDYGISVDLNVAAEIDDPVVDGVKYFKVGLADGAGNTCEAMYRAAAIINLYVTLRQTVLVHCKAGVSRGPAIAALYLYLYGGYATLDTAYAAVLAAHPESDRDADLWASIVVCGEPADCVNAETCCDPRQPTLAAPPSTATTPVTPTVYWNTRQCRTAYCSDGTPIQRCIEAGLYGAGNQANANAIASAYALSAAQAAAATECDEAGTVYWNDEQIAECPEGEEGDPVTVLANTVPSTVSKDDANAKALAQAEAGLQCGESPPAVYGNAEQTASCDSPGEGSDITIPANTYYASTQEAADTAAMNAALAARHCVFYNAALSGDCPEGSSGGPFEVSARTYQYEQVTTDTAEAAQAAADAFAAADLAEQIAEQCGISAQLDGLRWEMPTVGLLLGGGDHGWCADPALQSKVLAGTPGQLYAVVLRFRGVVEMKEYTGTPDMTACAGPLVDYPPPYGFKTGYGAFVTGGIPDPAGWNPSGANEYSLVVSNPGQTYWLNGMVRASSDPSSAYQFAWRQLCVKLDYTVSVQMRGGATITLRAQAKDGMEVANNTWVFYTTGGIPYHVFRITGIPDVADLPDSNPGQFIQMDVVSVTPIDD